jgi:putative MATE family efflux protein
VKVVNINLIAQGRARISQPGLDTGAGRIIRTNLRRFLDTLSLIFTGRKGGALNYIRNNKALILSIITLAMPAIIEMSLNTLVGVVDTVMISHYIGAEGLAAAGYANQLVFTIIFVFSSFNIGATAMISRSYGEKDISRLNRIMGQNITLNSIIGIIITIFCVVFGGIFLSIFDTTPQVYSLSLSYLEIVSWGQFFTFISFAAAATMRGASNTKTPMMITGCVNILNIAGNFVLMTGFWIFPELGIQGAAMSTAISRAIGALIYLLMLFKGNRGIKLKLTNLKLSTDILRSLWKLSSTAGLEQLLMQSSFFAMSIIVSVLDTTSEAAFRILLSIESISYTPAIGISIVTASLVGKGLGEKDRVKAKHTGYISITLGVLWGIVSGAVFVAFPTFILRLFTSDPEIIQRTLLGLRIAGIDQPLFAFVLVISGALRGAGDTKAVMILSTIRQWLCFVPFTYILIVLVGWGIESIYISEILTLLIMNTIFLLRFRGEKWADISV